MAVRPASMSCRSSLHSSKKVRLSWSTLVIILSPRLRSAIRGGRTSRGYSANGRDQALGIERLDHPSGGAGRAGKIALIGVALGGEDQDRRRFMDRVATQTADHLVAVHLRHVDVGDDNIDPLIAQ